VQLSPHLSSLAYQFKDFIEDGSAAHF